MIDMLKNKKAIVILLIILLLLMILIISRKIFKPKNDDKYVVDGTVGEQIEYVNTWKGKIRDITELGDYYIIKNIINKFYLNYSYMYTEDNSDNYFSDVVFDLLANQYIKENDITKENIKEKLDKIEENEVFILNAYNISNFDNEDIFIVECLIKEIYSGICIKNEVLLLRDNENMRFCIYPDNYVKKLGLNNITVGDSFDLSFDSKIEINNNNLYGAGAKDFNDYAKDIFDNYRKLLLYASDEAYKLLDPGFKDIYYPTYEKFKEFVDKNRTEIFLMTYSNYEASIVDEHYIFNINDKKDVFYLTFDASSLINLKVKIEKYI